MSDAPVKKLRKPRAKTPAAAAGAADDAEPVKRGPGRPPKQPPVPEQPIQGITTEPRQRGMLVELETNAVDKIKAAFTYLKKIKVTDVHFRFDPRTVRIFARGHDEQLCAIPCFNCEQLTTYYCASVLWITVVRETVADIFDSLSKAHYRFSIGIRQGDEKNIIITMHESEGKTAQVYVVPGVVGAPTDDQALLNYERCINPALLDKYPLRMKLSSKFLKSSATVINKFSSTFQIFHVAGESPCFEYVAQGVRYKQTFEDEKHVELHTTLGEDDGVLRITVPSKPIVHLASSLPTDVVVVYCHPTEPIVFHSKLHDSLDVYSFLAPYTET